MPGQHPKLDGGEEIRRGRRPKERLQLHARAQSPTPKTVTYDQETTVFVHLPTFIIVHLCILIIMAGAEAAVSWTGNA